MDNTRIKFSYNGLSGRQCDVNLTAFVEDAIDIVLIVEDVELKY